MQPTPEMKEWFETRTNQHIELVQKYAERIRAAYPEEFSNLDTSTHDASNFEEPEYTPYVFMTWKRLHPEFEYSDAIAEAGHQATLHHVRNNPHHPEYWTSKFSGDSVNKAMSSDFNRRDEPPKETVEATSMPEIAIAEMCFTGDTRISLLDGTECCIQDLVGRDTFWVYACTRTGEIVPSRGRNARKTATVNQIVYITLDNGALIKCTKDHKFLLRSGKYKKASDLVSGTSLMPLYRYEKEGYEEILDNKRNKRIYTHRLVVDKVLGGYPYFTKLLGTNKIVCHHINYMDPNNKHNNDPANLIVMRAEDHLKIHTEKQRLIGSEILRSLWKIPSFRKRQQERARILGKVTGPKNLSTYNKSQKHRQTASENITRMNKQSVLCPLCNLIFPNKACLGTHLKCTHNTDPEFKSRISKKNAKIWENPDYKARMAEEASLRMKTPIECSQCGDILPNKALLGKHIKKVHSKNHKIVSVEIKDELTDVYDITVDVYHNFALTAGVFVHNCADWCSMSEEMKNSPQEWADKNIGIRWGFTPKQIDLIHTLLDTIWETPEPLPERAGGGHLYGGREEEPPKKKSASPAPPSKRVLPPESTSTPTNEFGGFFGSLSMALPWSTARKMEVWDIIYKRVKERYWKTSVAKKGGDFRLLIRDFLDSEYGASIASDLLAAAQFSEFILIDTAKRCSMRSWDRYWSNWLEFAGWK